MKVDSKVFCLAGMHRSGTSLLANWFYDSGLYIGEELLGPASSNKKGHFEDLDFLALHTQDLVEKGYNNSGLILDDQNLRLGERSIAKACNILDKRNGKTVWGWKEPRATLYLLHWKELIPHLKVVAIYREPSLVIESLYERLKRNKWYKTNNPVRKLWWWLDIDKNPKKWKSIFLQAYEKYNHEIITFQKLYPEDIIIFELIELLAHPKVISNKICELLQIKDTFVDFNNLFERKNLNTNSLPCKDDSKTYKILKAINKKE